MDKYAKALGAAQGGLTSAAAVSAMAFAALQFMPEATRSAIPWWGYLAIFFAAAVVCVVFPALATFLAPANKPLDLPNKVDVPVNVPVDLSEVTKSVKVGPGKTASA